MTTQEEVLRQLLREGIALIQMLPVPLTLPLSIRLELFDWTNRAKEATR